MDVLSAVIVVSSSTAVVFGLAAYLMVRGRRDQTTTAALARAAAADLDIPPTLHPVIDPDICIGSLACVEACPEGSILGLVEGKAALVEANKCIGHGRCAAECPVGAISLVFGSSKRGIDLPEIDSNFETSRPGVHIVGELGGMGLIKNAVTQGVQLGEELARRCGESKTAKGTFDVAIVGAGPAGLATAAACSAAGLRYCVLEQESLGGTIAHYPRQKVVMSERVDIPGYGAFGRHRISKEDLLATWQDVVKRVGIRIHEGVRVEGLEGENDDFEVKTTRGAVKARKVVLALGRRGSPRKLGAEGEDLPKVTYRLIDPEQYEGRAVLVVGGGDSALEAAIALARDGGAEVSISYRSPKFGRCRPDNLKAIEELIASGEVRALMSSTVTRIEDDCVVLKVGESEERIDNDFVVVCIGGVLPTELLEKCGVTINRHFGDGPEKERRRERLQRAKGRRQLKRGKRSYFGLALTVLGAAIVVGLTLVGWDYYRLPAVERLHSPLHVALRPAGVWGHGIGMVASAVMLLNFLYAVRKRTRLLGRLGNLRSWLTFHTFVGIMSPIVIAFHAAFQSNNLLATGTAGSLAIVVGTGLFGRFVFGMIPTANGRMVTPAELESMWAAVKGAADESLRQKTCAPAAHKMLREAEQQLSTDASFLSLLFNGIFVGVAARRHARDVRSAFTDPNEYKSFTYAYVRLRRMRFQVLFYPKLKRVLTVWRAFHVVLSIFLVVVMSAHIVLALYLGYRWILF